MPSKSHGGHKFNRIEPITDAIHVVGRDELKNRHFTMSESESDSLSEKNVKWETPSSFILHLSIVSNTLRRFAFRCIACDAKLIYSNMAWSVENGFYQTGWVWLHRQDYFLLPTIQVSFLLVSKWSWHNFCFTYSRLYDHFYFWKHYRKLFWNK